MKKIFKIVMAVLGIVYLGIIVFVTGCLLFYNQYKVTQINDKTFIIIDDKSDMYKDGDLVIFTKNPNDEIVKGDEIFFYEITNGTVNVVSGTVTKSEKITDKETTFTINGNHNISSESVIGKIATASTYHNVGKVLYIFESRFGFLLLVILPALIFFFYEIYRLVTDIKASKEMSTNSTEAVSLQNNQATEPAVDTVQTTPATEPVVDTAQSTPATEPVVDTVQSVPTTEPVVDTVQTTVTTEPVVDNSQNIQADTSLSNSTSPVVSSDSSETTTNLGNENNVEANATESLDMNDKKE